jgi:hypothetical protein
MEVKGQSGRGSKSRSRGETRKQIIRGSVCARAGNLHG